MDLNQLNNLKINDIVYLVANTGYDGIYKYQYVGIVLVPNSNGEERYLFLSEYFVSVRSIIKGRESTSTSLKKLFLTEQEAIAYQNELRKQEQHRQF